LKQAAKMSEICYYTLLSLNIKQFLKKAHDFARFLDFGMLET
jgi:hypothetical protein